MLKLSIIMSASVAILAAILIIFHAEPDARFRIIMYIITFGIMCFGLGYDYNTWRNSQ